MVGYTKPLAAAVWLGTTDGAPLSTKDGSSSVSGAGQAAPIWRQFMVATTEAMRLDKEKSRFTAPKFPPRTVAPSLAPSLPASRPAAPSPRPTCVPPDCPGRPSRTPPPPTPSPPPTPVASQPPQR